MLRRRISNYDGDADDGKEIGAKVAFKGTTDKVESVDSNVTGGKPAKTEPTERPQRDTKRDSTRTGKRDNAGKPNQSRASSGPRNDRPSGVNRQVPVPKTIEVDKEGDYVDTGVALPGDVVGIAEEFKAGKNTYKRGGNI